MALPVPPINADGTLRYYTGSEYAQIDIRRRGVSGEGDHTHEQMGPDGAGTPRLYSCKWDERYAAALALVGFAQSYVDVTATPTQDRISRLLPDTYGIVAGHQWVCTKVRIDPFKYMGFINPIFEGIGAPVFDRAHIEATYELVPYALFEDGATPVDDEFKRYVTYPGLPHAEISTESNYIGLPGGTLKYVTAGGVARPAGVSVPYPFGFVENYRNLPYIWHRVPIDLWGPFAALTARVLGDGTRANRGMIGALNKTQFDGYAPLTLQLRNVEERLIPDPLGLGYSWEIVYRMSNKPVPFGHLGFYFHSVAVADGASAGYYETVRASRAANTEIAAGAIADNDALFHVREFNDLFQFFA